MLKAFRFLSLPKFNNHTLLFIVLAPYLWSESMPAVELEKHKTDKYQPVVKETIFTVAFDNGGQAVKVVCPEYKNVKSIFTSTFGRMPIQEQSCRKTQAKTVIWLHGGPFAKSRSQVNIEKALYIAQGYLLAEPQFIGSQERPLDFVNGMIINNFGAGIKELRRLVLYYQRRNKPIIIHGESFGALVGLILSDMLSGQDILVLQNPSTASPRQQLLTRDDVFMSVSGLAVGIGDAQPLDFERLPHSQKLVAQEYFLNQFFKDYYDQSLPKIIENKKIKSKIKIIYGLRDKKISVRYLEGLKSKINRVQKLELKEAGHDEIGSPEHYKLYREFIFERQPVVGRK